MASKQSLANKHHYENLVAHAKELEAMPPGEATAWNDAEWTKLTAEPGGVDFIEVEVADRAALWIVPKGAVQDRVILYVHGGGFVGGSIYTHRKMIGHLAKATKCRALAVGYSSVFQDKYPTQRLEVGAAYRWLLDTGVKPEHLVGAADSAGAAVLFGAMLAARDAGLPLPAALLGISGWFDMAASGQSYETNRSKDAFFQKQTVDWLAGMVIGDADLRAPYASPLYAELAGLPPTYLQVGSDEALLDDSVAMAAAMTSAGVDVRLEVFPEMLHSFQMMAGAAPEVDDAIGRFADWLRPRLALPAATGKAA